MLGSDDAGSDDESSNETRLMVFSKKTFFKKSYGKKQMRKHKTMLNALKKYKKLKTEEENQPIDKLGRLDTIQKK